MTPLVTFQRGHNLMLHLALQLPSTITWPDHPRYQSGDLAAEGYPAPVPDPTTPDISPGTWRQRVTRYRRLTRPPPTSVRRHGKKRFLAHHRLTQPPPKSVRRPGGRGLPSTIAWPNHPRNQSGDLAAEGYPAASPDSTTPEISPATWRQRVTQHHRLTRPPPTSVRRSGGRGVTQHHRQNRPSRHQSGGNPATWRQRITQQHRLTRPAPTSVRRPGVRGLPSTITWPDQPRHQSGDLVADGYPAASPDPTTPEIGPATWRQRVTQHHRLTRPPRKSAWRPGGWGLPSTIA